MNSVSDLFKSDLICKLKYFVLHLFYMWTMSSFAAVQEIFETVFQQMCLLRIDVITTDLNDVVYKRYKKQKYEDLQNSSLVIILREMQREVNLDLPIFQEIYIILYR